MRRLASFYDLYFEMLITVKCVILTSEVMYMATIHEAVLSNEKNFTVFQYGRHKIRFRAPYSLERYTRVKEWDRGYLVVMAKYRHRDKEEEEYIDLSPILENLYFDSEAFLSPIEKVRVADDGY